MKRTIMAVGLAIGLMAAVAAVAGDGVPSYGYASLGDVDHLMYWTGKVQTAMSSSTDTTGCNMDMIYNQGKYKGEKILAEIEGPGCVYRVWAAMASGTMKVYLDGSETPEFKCGFKDYLEGKCAELPGDFAVGRAAGYMPICFAESALVTAKGFRFPAYYQVSYQTYDKSVVVTTFDKDTAMSDPGLETAKAAWEHGVIPKDRSYSVKNVEAKLPPDRGEVVIDIPGAGIIRKLSVKNPTDPSDRLQGLTLRITWDGDNVPAVDVPLDAFFINYFDLKNDWPGGSLASYFISANSDGYVSEFPMPFSNGARIEVINPDSEVKKISMKVLYEKKESICPSAMRFHAFFRSQEYEENMTRENNLKMFDPVDPATNYIVLEREGKGHYVGCAIFVKSVGKIWWGEGDEMTYIDGADIPQIRGTGTEDEFNWSWGFMPHLSPVSGTLPVVPECKEPGAAEFIPQLRNKECHQIRGENISYRFRPSDYVPYEKSLKISYEVLGISRYNTTNFFAGNLSQTRGDDYASIAYWYEMP